MIDYSSLDPGIKGLVELLNKHGYATTDSGDGMSKDDPDIDFPHVFILSDKFNLLEEADQLWDLLGQLCDLPLDASIEATYSPNDGLAVIGVFNVLDVHIKRVN